LTVGSDKHLQTADVSYRASCLIHCVQSTILIIESGFVNVFHSQSIRLATGFWVSRRLLFFEWDYVYHPSLSSLKIALTL